METEITIRQETPADFRETESLVREAFWNVYRPGCLEHFVVHELRNSPDFCPELDLVLVCGGQLAGQVMLLRNRLALSDGTEVPVLTLGPICIRPQFQHRGYGLRLLNHVLAEAGKTGAAGVFLEGNIGFYGKAGFVVASTLGIGYMDEPPEDPVPYFLAKVLRPEVFTAGFRARYRVPQVYFVEEKQAEEFDRQFPPKEKLRLPGQLF